MRLQHVGRRRIFTDEKYIDASNIVKVLARAYTVHCANVMDMKFLIDYEAGEHPEIRDRKKEVRPDINYKVVDNIAHYVTRFHVGYFWGAPFMYIQRGNNEGHPTDSVIDDEGITGLNEMLRNGEDISSKRQEIARYVEKTGIGHSMVDVMTEDEFDEDYALTFTGDDGKEHYAGSLCHVYDLNSEYTFCVYHNGIGRKKVMGVTYTVREDASVRFTCYTDKSVFEIANGEIVSETINVLGKIPIVEWRRDIDITGCFEHCIDDMDALDAQSSDIANDSTQRTQDIWWGHNIGLPTDANGNVQEPKSGEWVLTVTPQGLNDRASDAKIAPLASTYDGASAQNQLYRKFNHILQKCYVPIQAESSGGGSTGSAMDMSAGWSAAELDALQEQNSIEPAAREELRLIIRAIRFVPERILSVDHPIRKVHSTDIDIHFSRRRNYDLSVKANAFATLVGRGIHPRHAIKVCEIFEDSEQVWNDSKDMILEYQKKVCVAQPTQTGGEATDPEKELGSDDRILQDLSDQVSNSPRLQSGV